MSDFNPTPKQRANLANKIETIAKLDPSLALWIGKQAVNGDNKERIVERLRHAVAELDREVAT